MALLFASRTVHHMCKFVQHLYITVIAICIRQAKREYDQTGKKGI